MLYFQSISDGPNWPNYTSQQKKGIFCCFGRYCSISYTTKNIGGMEIFGHQFCIY